MQDHRYVLHLTMVYTNGGRISATDRLVLLYSPSFAGAVRDIYCTVLNGATLLHFDVKREGLTDLADWLRRERITVFFAVATMFRHFCRLLTPQDRFPLVRSSSWAAKRSMPVTFVSSSVISPRIVG